MPSKNKIVTEGDPLAYLMLPPPNETEEQKQARMAAEAEAKRISDAIDEELQRQAKAEKRAPKPVKILLLGQSESGTWHGLFAPSPPVDSGMRPRQINNTEE